MTLVAFVGFKGAGKNSAAIPLQRRGYVAFSFADAIKDALASIFCWPREMLEGDTPESRTWREQVDPWWAERLDIEDFSPRGAMQLVGTEAMRAHFHPEVWTLNVERRIDLLPADSDVVLIDGRFANEIAMARRRGGKVFRVRRGDDPVWMHTAGAANLGYAPAQAAMREVHQVHVSEYAWVGEPVDGVFENNASVEDLHRQVESVVF